MTSEATRDALVFRLPWPPTRDLWEWLPQSALLTSMAVHGDDGLEELLPRSISRGFTCELLLNWSRGVFVGGEPVPAVSIAIGTIVLPRAALTQGERRALIRSLEDLVVQYQYMPDLDRVIEARNIARKARFRRIWESAPQ